MLSFCMNIDSLSAMLNEFEMHSVFCRGLVWRIELFDVKWEHLFLQYC